MRASIAILASFVLAACQPAPEDDPEKSGQVTPRDETGDPIPSVDSATYVLLDAKRLPTGTVQAISRRDSVDGTSVYSNREYRCEDRTFRYIGSGDTRADAEKNKTSTDSFSELIEGSSAYLTGQVACKKLGAKFKAT